MPGPNIGDLLMLSQVAWRIGRAFASGQKNAPVEFQEVETEISNLAKALKQLAEALHAEGENGLIHEAGEDIQQDIGYILESCKRTVNDLDSLVDHNQVIKKHRTVGGFAIERSWSNLVLAEYMTMMWTAEGGGLYNLRDLIHMHTSSITLLIQALQRQRGPPQFGNVGTNFDSNSSAHLESVVVPMADRINCIHEKHGSLDQQLDDVFRMVESLMITTSGPQSPPIPARNPARSPTVEASNPPSSALKSVSPLAIPPQRQNTKISLPHSPQRSESHNQSTSPRPTISVRAPSSPTETMTTSRASSPTQKRVSEFSFGSSSLRYSSSSYASSTASSGGWSHPGTPRDSFINRQPSTSTRKTSPLPQTPEIREPGEDPHEDSLPLLPPPAMGYTMHSELERVTSRSTLNLYPSTQPDLVKLQRSSTTASQKAVFEKEAFRNSAILCDV
jgi:hypothetical protein